MNKLAHYILIGGILAALGGCGALAYKPTTADETVQLVKQANASGCSYQRYTGNARPYADVSTNILSVYVVGKGVTFKDCMQEIPAEAKALLLQTN